MRTVLVIGLLCLLLFAPLASALPLNLDQDPPDIRIDNMSISYNATTDQFVATGDPVTYDPTGVPPYTPITGTRSYNITATINAQGGASAGTVTIIGDTFDKGGNPVSGTLLTGSLLTGTFRVFGFDPDAAVYVPLPPYFEPIDEYPAKFEFLMSTSGGALVSDFGGVGSLMGIIAVSNLGGFPGHFNNDFTLTTDYLISADNFAVIPEPASISLLLGGALALAARRRRSRAKRLGTR